jgi:hypothetical protein
MTNEELDDAREIEAIRIYELEQNDPKGHGVARIAARLAREGWTPPVPVDPDLVEAKRLVRLPGRDGLDELALAGIKRGRALAAAETKPGMVWKKWDGATESPVFIADYVWIKNMCGTSVYHRNSVAWSHATHYCVVPQPEDAA